MAWSVINPSSDVWTVLPVVRPSITLEQLSAIRSLVDDIPMLVDEIDGEAWIDFARSSDVWSAA